MSNTEFEKFLPLVKNIVNKYKNCGIEYEDLIQVGSLGVLYAYNHYDENRNTKFSYWVYKCIEFFIKKEIGKNKSVKAFLSLSQPAGDDDTIPLEETISSGENIEDNAIDKLVAEAYYQEINEKLEYKKATALTLKVFHNYRYENIAEEMGIKKENVNGIILQARRDLLCKSSMIREAYLDYTRSKIDYYKNPGNVINTIDRVRKVEAI